MTTRSSPACSAGQWQRVIDVSLNGFFNVTQPLMLPMIRTRWGRIINISSVSAVMGNRGQVNYSAAKGALHAATKSLSLEVASRGITVNAVAPGIIDTGMAEGNFSAEDIARMVPMKRAGKAGRSGRARGLPRLGTRQLHHRPDHFDQWRNGLKEHIE